jgi:hypothetical protein
VTGSLSRNDGHLACFCLYREDLQAWGWPQQVLRSLEFGPVFVWSISVLDKQNAATRWLPNLDQIWTR